MNDKSKAIVQSKAQEIADALKYIMHYNVEIVITDGALEIFYAKPESWQFNPPADLTIGADGELYVRPQ